MFEMGSGKIENTTDHHQDGGKKSNVWWCWRTRPRKRERAGDVLSVLSRREEKSFLVL